MRKLILLLLILCMTSIYAQEDQIFKHNGEVIEGEVIKNDGEVIVFKYKGESVENTLASVAVEKVIFGSSGRIQNISDKINIDSDKGWEKVMVFYVSELIRGLTRKGDIKGKTGMINYHTTNTGDRKAEKKLKIEAAKIKAPFVLMVDEKNSVGGSSNMFGGSQAVKKGVAYSY